MQKFNEKLAAQVQAQLEKIAAPPRVIPDPVAPVTPAPVDPVAPVTPAPVAPVTPAGGGAVAGGGAPTLKPGANNSLSVGGPTGGRDTFMSDPRSGTGARFTPQKPMSNLPNDAVSADFDPAMAGKGLSRPANVGRGGAMRPMKYAR